MNRHEIYGVMKLVNPMNEEIRQDLITKAKAVAVAAADVDLSGVTIATAVTAGGTLAAADQATIKALFIAAETAAGFDAGMPYPDLPFVLTTDQLVELAGEIEEAYEMPSALEMVKHLYSRMQVVRNETK